METSINQSISTIPLVIPTMAGSRTYVGPAYYDFRQLVTGLVERAISGPVDAEESDMGNGN